MVLVLIHVPLSLHGFVVFHFHLCLSPFVVVFVVVEVLGVLVVVFVEGVLGVLGVVVVFVVAACLPFTVKAAP